MQGRRLVFFDFDAGEPADGQTWLQITSIAGAGDTGKSEIRQKIIRLNEEDQRKLYAMLKERFEK